MIQYDRVINGVTSKIFRPVKEGYPSKSTLHKESLLLWQLFEFGQRRGYITKDPEINVPKDIRRKINSRPGFTMEEFLHLKSIPEQRVRD